jgi:DNA mismatch endonuclease, patch repair protein
VADIFSEEKRSYVMSCVSSKDTKPEKIVRSYLHRSGFRFRLHAPGLPGKPDLVLAKHKTAIFVHGCFWHRHPRCKRSTTPSTRKEFWIEKFRKNVARDKRNYKQLKEQGWEVIVIWACKLENTKSRKDALSNLVRTLNCSTCKVVDVSEEKRHDSQRLASET